MRLIRRTILILGLAGMKHIQRLVLVLGIVLGLPKVAFAYVDPGILSVLYQAIYVVVFGAVATFIFKPWNYVKSLFRKPKPDAQSPQESDSGDRAE